MEKLPNITSITSGGNRLDTQAHEVDLQAVTSQQFSLEAVAVGLTSEQKFYILRRLEFGHLESLDDLPPQATFMLEKISTLEINEAVEILREFLKQHGSDMNISHELVLFIERLVEGQTSDSSSSKTEDASQDEKKDEAVERLEPIGPSLSGGSGFEKEIFDWELQTKTEAGMIAFWSPYAEVRAVTDPYDDPNIPCETWRVYFLGLVWTVLSCIINQYFFSRQPSISLSTSVAQLFLYPCGKALERFVPRFTFNIGKYAFDSNPGPWTHKEQMLSTLFFSVSGGSLNATWFIMNLKLERFYGVQWVDFGWQLLLVLSTNFLGFGLAGVFRKFLVYPVTSLWPTLLPTMALNKALTIPEKKTLTHGWTISRYSFYFIVTGISFLYFWLPDYLFTALSTFNWIAWIKPDNFQLATITGSQTGLGLNPITTFDWNNILNSPLAVPFFSQVNNYTGMFVSFFCVIGLWYSNYKWTGFLPINSNQIFTNEGLPYNVRAVLNKDHILDPEKYAKYGPPFYTAANLITYGSFFAIYPLIVFYVLFTSWGQIKFAFVSMYKTVKNRRLNASTYEGFNDPFSRSMTAYKEVPEWVFTIVLVISLVLGIIMLKVYPMNTPVWTLFFAIGINFVFLLPSSIIYAATGQQIELNVLVEMISGYALPGNGIALNVMKVFGTFIDSQADNYITNQKQAHYLRIPPRSLFRVQMLSIMVTSFVALGILNLTFSTILDYCDPRNPNKFTCPGSTTYYSASVLWGVIGPKRVFGGLYPVLQWTFLIGFLLAVFFWGVHKLRRRIPILRNFHPVVFVTGFIQWAPYNLSYYTPGMILSYFFMYVIRRRYTSWWEKYNYILSGGLSAGIAFSSIIIYFSVQYHPKYISWWGNNVNDNGYDAMGMARLNVTLDAPDGYFGPRIGHFP